MAKGPVNLEGDRFPGLLKDQTSVAGLPAINLVVHPRNGGVPIAPVKSSKSNTVGVPTTMIDNISRLMKQKSFKGRNLH